LQVPASSPPDTLRDYTSGTCRSLRRMLAAFVAPLICSAAWGARVCTNNLNTQPAAVAAFAQTTLISSLPPFTLSLLYNLLWESKTRLASCNPGGNRSIILLKELEASFCNSPGYANRTKSFLITSHEFFSPLFTLASTVFIPTFV